MSDKADKKTSREHFRFPGLKKLPKLKRVEEYIKDAEYLSLIDKAYDFAVEQHQSQRRESGEPYVSHCIAVAQILIDFHLDPVTICAALLHDTIEDTGTSAEEIGDLFGSDVVELVDGLTKLPKQAYVSGDFRQAENYRKMLFACARDLRVILIKLADRLHNMRTLQFVGEAKQRRIAAETKEIYAPLANRLGIATIKWELEDLSFRYLEPDIYQDIRRQMSKKRRERERFVEHCRKVIKDKLKEVGIEAEVKGRPKHFYSIYQKMVRQGISFDRVYDQAGVRIICEQNEVKHCYHVLGIIHTLWPPIQDRFKDHIAIPKSNMYRSIHTTVIGPKGEPLEVQIRTREMDRVAEVGIAAHWKYKEGSKVMKKNEEQFDWLHQLLDWVKELDDPTDFIENFKIDLFPNEIYVFTPNGEVKFLPRGATPVDFAFSIHSEVGRHCTGALVNKVMVPLHYQLRSGDQVDILTSKKQLPSPDWLKFAKTSRARSKIRREIRDRHRSHSIELGKELFKQELKRYHKQINRVMKSHASEIEALAGKLGAKNTEDLFALIGLGRIHAHQVTQMLYGELDKEEEKAEESESTITRIVKKAFGRDGALKVDGLDNMLISYAKCCNPVPGDEIVGFITRGRGITVHTRDCSNLEALRATEPRFVHVSWNISKDAAFTVQIKVTARDRKGLLADTTSTITKLDTNILSGQMEAYGAHEQATGTFLLEVKNTQQLDKVMSALRKVKGVVKVVRLKA